MPAENRPCTRSTVASPYMLLPKAECPEMEDSEICTSCRGPLPPNWGMAFCNAQCAKAYNAARTKKDTEPTLIKVGKLL